MLSIIIPCLNEEDYLPGLLRSIKIQTFKDYEIIVADAGSKDKTKEIAQKFGCKIVRGGLPAKGRNEGAKAAQGELLLFLDADTKLPDKDFLKRILGEFRQRKLDIASCFLRPLERSKFLNQKFVNICFEITNRLLVLFEKKSPFGAGSMILVKKEFHQKIGGFNEKIRLGEDVVYIKKGAKLGNFGILRKGEIFWSIRRLEKEKWFRIMALYLLNGILSFSRNEKMMERYFKDGILKYHFDHYKKDRYSQKDYIYKKFKNILKQKFGEIDPVRGWRDKLK